MLVNLTNGYFFKKFLAQVMNALTINTVKQRGSKQSGLGKGDILVMFNKKGLVLLAGGVLTLGTLAACGGTSNTDSSKLTIWCPTSDSEVVNTIISRFKESHPEYSEWAIEISGNVSEAEVATNLNKDKANAADIMFAADDNIRMGVDGEGLLELTQEEVDTIEENDGADAVNAVTVDGKVYGFPYRDDNTYMLFYDDRYITAEQAKSVEDIFAACLANNVSFMWDLDSGWYSVSAPTAYLDGIWVSESGEIDSDLYSTKGIQLYEYIMQLRTQYGTAWSFDSTNGVVENGFGADVDIEAGEDGTTPTVPQLGAALWWNDPLLLANEHVHVTELPSLHVNGVEGQLKPFKGFKAVVINILVSEIPEKEQLARDFAAYCASKESQELFYSQLGYGGCNDEVAAEITDSPFLAAVALQGDATLPQGANVTNDYWTPMETWGKYISTGSWGNAGDAETALDMLVNDNDGWVHYNDVIQNGTIGDLA